MSRFKVMIWILPVDSELWRTPGIIQAQRVGLARP